VVQCCEIPDRNFRFNQYFPTEDGSFNVTGNLTLHGVIKAVALAAHFVNTGVNPITKAYTVGFEASTVIKRDDFGGSTML
jgi:polyisoprenoid-binding protein YceI